MTGKSTVSKPPTVLSSPQIMFFLVYTIQMSLYYTNSAAYLSAGMVEKVHQAISVLDYNSVKINVYDSCAWVFYTSAGRSCRMDCPACLAYSLSKPLSLCHPVVVTFSISLLCWIRYKSPTITHVAHLTNREKKNSLSCNTMKRLFLPNTSTYWRPGHFPFKSMTGIPFP